MDERGGENTVEMKLISKKYHSKKVDDYLEEWWTLTFKDGDDQVIQRIDMNTYSDSDWIDGAVYKCVRIESDDVLEGSIPKGHQTKLDAVLTPTKKK